MLRFTENVNEAIFWIMTLAYLYQFIFLVIGFAIRKKKDRYMPGQLHKFAAIIAARNEEAVIGELIRNLKGQNYPAHLLDVFVIADNCTDNTAQIARECGAIVYERFDRTKVGKGYALDLIFHKIYSNHRQAGYEGFFVFDADNLIAPDFVKEMNKVFDRGYQVVTSYRNSKNYGTNWISAGYSLWFLREARFLNSPRMAMNTGCAISGTGFLVGAELIRQNKGWPFHLLTEDIEFSVNCALQNVKIGYCENAKIYDEQPVTFEQSWTQRLRWSKGFYQVTRKYGLSLVKGIFHGKGSSFTCYDMLMTIAPASMLTIGCIGFNVTMLLLGLTEPMYVVRRLFDATVHSLVFAVGSFYVVMFLYGLLTVISEWKQIPAGTREKVLYLFTFPVFIFTYVPIALKALFCKVEWKPIRHSVSKTLEDLS